MKKLIVLIFTVLLFSGNLYSQDAEKFTLGFDIISAPVKFSFDGKQSFFKTPAIIGVAGDTNFLGLDVSPGIYLSMELGNDSDDSKLGLVFNLKIFKALGVGFYWEYWLNGSGFELPEKRNSGISLSMDIDL